MRNIKCLSNLNQTIPFCDQEAPLILEVFCDLLITYYTTDGMQRYTFNTRILASVGAIFRYAKEQSSLIVL